jgi:hypothetical protein
MLTREKKRAEGKAKAIEHLPSKSEALSLYPSTVKKSKQKQKHKNNRFTLPILMSH